MFAEQPRLGIRDKDNVRVTACGRLRQSPWEVKQECLAPLVLAIGVSNAQDTGSGRNDSC